MSKTTIPIKWERKTFKDYYDDPKYRKKHLDYMKQKIQCECDVITRRCNMSKHRKTAAHIKWVEENNKYKVKYLPRVKKLKEKVEKINDELKYIMKKLENIK